MNNDLSAVGLTANSPTWGVDVNSSTADPWRDCFGVVHMRANMAIFLNKLKSLTS